MVDINDMWDDEEDMEMHSKSKSARATVEYVDDDVYIYDGFGLTVVVNNVSEVGFSGCVRDGGYERCSREEAIAAAKAILKHYDIDFNAYEDNVSERYRPLTKAEMEQHLKDNHNLVPVVIDPDAPLTSELAERFKGELK